ncbi:unnamed protein product [Nesidiocoris tenuis]|uniref:Uncharacterized protein n=1 Tax=Nesidiocoris tenuis TaxID=355587 RepID=A0A6H5H2U8_9HEMI|nr:unnamed protein product [Nesidiocoris tenuis]
MKRHSAMRWKSKISACTRHASPPELKFGRSFCHREIIKTKTELTLTLTVHESFVIFLDFHVHHGHKKACPSIFEEEKLENLIRRRKHEGERSPRSRQSIRGQLQDSRRPYWRRAILLINPPLQYSDGRLDKTKRKNRRPIGLQLRCRLSLRPPRPIAAPGHARSDRSHGDRLVRQIRTNFSFKCEAAVKSELGDPSGDPICDPICDPSGDPIGGDVSESGGNVTSGSGPPPPSSSPPPTPQRSSRLLRTERPNAAELRFFISEMLLFSSLRSLFTVDAFISEEVRNFCECDVFATLDDDVVVLLLDIWKRENDNE